MLVRHQKGPYTSAVSTNVTPSSAADLITEIIFCLSLGGPTDGKQKRAIELPRIQFDKTLCP